jgi:hypothetical protein
MTKCKLYDEGLLAYATETQAAALKAVNETGSYSAAAQLLGVHRDGPRKRLVSLEIEAARRGYAPGHFDAGVPAGYAMGKVTIQRHNGDGTFRWERMEPLLEAQLERIRATVEALKEELPAAKTVKVPRVANDDLCTQYTVTDFHLGELSHASEGDGLGADWNLEIAEETLVSAITNLADKGPGAGTAILALMGDLLHFDGPDPVTPTNRHPLQAAGTLRGMVRTVVRALRRVVRYLLTKHRLVKIVIVEGNHDLASTPWLQEILLTHYEDEPRVEVSNNELPFYATTFGVNFIGFHHGHKKEKSALPILFAAMFREQWGATKKGYIHTGHLHHEDVKEHPGVKVMQHNTITTPGNHGLRGGWLSEREMAAIHYHVRFGLIGRDIVTPEMLEAA